jgi:hypothetical protein
MGKEMERKARPREFWGHITQLAGGNAGFWPED